jgi:hypothetical protein
MSVADKIAAVGVAVMVLGYLAMVAAPKVPPENIDSPDAWITPDDYSVQPWTFGMFFAGFALALLGLGAGGLHDRFGWPESMAFAGELWVLIVLAAWMVGVHRLTKRRQR